MVRRSAIPTGTPPLAAGAPAGLGKDPLKPPQETQSSSSQQAAPPAGDREGAEASGKSAVIPNSASAAELASRIVLWLASPVTLAERVELPINFPVPS